MHKGWMQTWCTHMQSPGRLFRDLGPLGFLSFQLIVGGNVLAALVHPLFLAGLVIACLNGTSPWSDELAAKVATTVYGTMAACGYLVSGVFGWLGLRRRGLSSLAWALALMPLHWLLLSLAAWRALYQLFAAPYKWEKTEHGLAKRVRRNPDSGHILIELERLLGRLKQASEHPQTPGRTTGTCAGHSPHPVAGASG
jgi:hypothetical protein